MRVREVPWLLVLDTERKGSEARAHVCEDKRYVSIELSVASQSNKYSKLACEGVQHDPRCADGLNCTVEQSSWQLLGGKEWY